MKVIFHEKYKEVYASDPAAAYGRIDCIFDELKENYDFVEPVPADKEDLLLVHTQRHVEHIKNRRVIYETALQAAGGAIKAAELALQGEKAFGLIRPPGHHASPDSCWGFCWFNNIAIAVEKMRKNGKIKTALIIDFDLHYGDGTANIFAGIPEVIYHHVEGYNRQVFIDDLKKFLAAYKNYDLMAISAGFDKHEKDWGGLLRTEDYTTIGEILKDHANQVCKGRAFAVLEGGYNHNVLGKNVKAFLEGFSG